MQLISTHIPFTENMSNPKPDFPTVIHRLQSIHRTLVLAVNAAQTKA